MNILLLTSEFSPATGGIATYVREIAAAATRLGARMTVVAPDYFDPQVDRDDTALPYPVERFIGGLHSMRDAPAKARLALDVIGREDYDIVHAADWPFFIPLGLARGRTRARLLMTVHGTEINEMQTRAKRLAVRLSGVFGPRAEVAANSNYTRDLLLSSFPARDHQVRAVPLGVSAFWFGPQAPRAQIRQQLEIDPGAIVMVTVARQTRRKGHLATLAALARLPDDLRRRITWLLIGPEGERDHVQNLHSAIAATDCDIRLLGTLSNAQIRDVYGAADFFCLTGLWDPSGRVEGFGLVFLEAGAAGLPSVATAVGGVPDAVLADQGGLLVEPDVDAIAAAIARMASNDSLRVHLQGGARRHAHYLSWERCAALTYGLALPARQPASELDHVAAPAI